MGGYELLLFAHVVGAVVWVGVGFTSHVLLLWADRENERRFAARLQAAIEAIEVPVAVAGPGLLLATGIALVIDGPWSFGDTWVVVGLAGYVAALGIGAAFEGPEGRRLGEIVRERGPDDPEAIARGRRLNGVMWLELAVLAVILLAMTVKPSGGGSVAFWGAAAAIGLGAGWAAARAVGQPTLITRTPTAS